MSNISEKDVDYKVQQQFEKLGFYYFTTFRNEPYKSLIGRLIPDGLLVHNNNLLIIENKVELKDESKARQQLSTYVETVTSNGWSGDIVCIFGHKDGVKIYDRDLNEQQVELNTILEAKFNKITQSVETLFHDLHNFIVKNIKTDDNNELCFLCLALLLTTMKTDVSSASDEVIYMIVKDIVQKDIPELSPLVQNIEPEHISILIKKVYTLYAMVGKDVYLKLYQEFCKYSKANDEKNIVLTPDWIVRLMTRCLELDPNKKYNIFDPCVGTGSLIMGCADDNNTLYGCEINKKMYVLCKGLFLMSDPRYNVQLKDMFKIKTNVKFDRIIMNPPYTKKLTGKHAIEFITYSVDHFLKDNGILVAIFPTGQLKTIKAYQPYKEYIYNNCDILSVINLGKCFDDAFIECSILVLRKTCVKNNVNTKIYNFIKSSSLMVKVPYGSYKFTNQGTELYNNILNNKCYNELNINDYSMDWTEVSEKMNPIERLKQTIEKLDKPKFKARLYELIDECFETRNVEGLEQHVKNIIERYYSKFETFEYQLYKIGDLFENVKTTSCAANNDLNEGMYPLVSSSMKNNGVVKYINEYDLDGEYLVVSCAREPNTGFTSYHKGKFSVTSCVKVLKPKNNIDIENIPDYFTKHLSETYNRNNPLTTELLMNEEILLPKLMFKYKLSDIFEIVSPKKGYKKYSSHEIIDNKDESHVIPYYSAINHNNGLKGYVEEAAFDEGEYFLVCKTGNGAGGYFYYVEAPFNFNSVIMVLKLKKDLKNKTEFAQYLTNIFKQKINYSNNFSISTLDEEIYLDFKIC
jgi:predicted RNA methylase